MRVDREFNRSRPIARPENAAPDSRTNRGRVRLAVWIGFPAVLAICCTVIPIITDRLGNKEAMPTGNMTNDRTMLTEMNSTARSVRRYNSLLSKLEKGSKRLLVPDRILTSLAAPIKSRRDAAYQDFLQKKNDFENRPLQAAEGAEVLTNFPSMREASIAGRKLSSVGIQTEIHTRFSESGSNQVFHVVVWHADAAQTRQELLRIHREEIDDPQLPLKPEPEPQPAE